MAESYMNIDMNKVHFFCYNFFINKVVVHLNVFCPSMIY